MLLSHSQNKVQKEIQSSEVIHSFWPSVLETMHMEQTLYERKRTNK